MEQLWATEMAMVHRTPFRSIIPFYPTPFSKISMLTPWFGTATVRLSIPSPTRIQAGGGVHVPNSVYFTANKDDQYTVSFTMKNMLGAVLDSETTSPQALTNMAPVANASVSSNFSQTYEKIQFTGDGFDAWGLSLDNNTLPYFDQPVAYTWNFDDNMTSGLRSPLRSFAQSGLYNTTLRVMDVGGTWSDVSINQINITDDSEPIPIITVNNNIVADRLEILTNQRIIFSAYQTADNVPLEYLDFECGLGRWFSCNVWYGTVHSQSRMGGRRRSRTKPTFLH